MVLVQRRDTRVRANLRGKRPMDAALRAAKIEGLADDVWAAISRLNAGRNRVATAVENLEKRDASVAPQRRSLSPGA